MTGKRNSTQSKKSIVSGTQESNIIAHVEPVQESKPIILKDDSIGLAGPDRNEELMAAKEEEDKKELMTIEKDAAASSQETAHIAAAANDASAAVSAVSADARQKSYENLTVEER